MGSTPVHLCCVVFTDYGIQTETLQRAMKIILKESNQCTAVTGLNYDDVKYDMRAVKGLRLHFK